MHSARVHCHCHGESWSTATTSLKQVFIASGSGIGGGVLLLPINMFLLSLPERQAVALSNFTIFAGSLANLFFNLRKRHPADGKRGLISWQLIAIMEPVTLLGARLGGNFSKVLPSQITVLLMSFLIGLITCLTFRRGILTYEAETQAQEARGQPPAAFPGFSPPPPLSSEPHDASVIVSAAALLLRKSPSDRDRPPSGPGSRRAGVGPGHSIPIRLHHLAPAHHRHPAAAPGPAGPSAVSSVTGGPRTGDNSRETSAHWLLDQMSVSTCLRGHEDGGTLPSTALTTPRSLGSGSGSDHTSVVNHEIPQAQETLGHWSSSRAAPSFAEMAGAADRQAEKPTATPATGSGRGLHRVRGSSIDYRGAEEPAAPDEASVVTLVDIEAQAHTARSPVPALSRALTIEEHLQIVGLNVGTDGPVEDSQHTTTSIPTTPTLLVPAEGGQSAHNQNKTSPTPVPHHLSEHLLATVAGENADDGDVLDPPHTGTAARPHRWSDWSLTRYSSSPEPTVTRRSSKLPAMRQFERRSMRRFPLDIILPLLLFTG